MRRLLSILFVLAGFVLPGTAVGSSLYDRGYDAWRAQAFPEAYSVLLDFRRTPYGRQPAVDFMLGTSACRMQGRQGWGYNVLDWMLYAYALTFDSRGKVVHERDICRQVALDTTVGTEITEIVEERAAGMTGFGKVFYWAAQERQPVASYPIRRKHDIDRATFEARLIPLSEPERALAQAKRLSGGSDAILHDRFVIASRAGHSEQDLTAIGQTLTRYLRFLESRYGIRPPDYFLAIYLVDSHYAVNSFAEELHGLDVSRATIGYAFVDDLSVVAAVPDRGAGTVLHELFHLMTRSGFGDIPQWLDEGIASLYEVSGRDGDRYFGLANWRGRVLEELWDARPTVRELIRTEWFLFDNPNQRAQVAEGNQYPEMYFESREGREQAAMMAMARYFVLYLDERNELAPVYEAIRDQEFDDIAGNARDRAVALVETALGRSADALDDEFVAWFRDGGPERHRRPVITGENIFIATANVNIRTGPGTAFSKLMQIRKGSSVAVFGEAEGWREIRLRDGTKGYISGQYLTRAEATRWTPEN